MSETEAMGLLIYRRMRELLTEMREEHEFTNGEVMSAAMNLVIDAGLESVESGLCTPERLIADIQSSARGNVLLKTGESIS